MSRVLCIAALAAVGLFVFSSAIQAADRPAGGDSARRRQHDHAYDNRSHRGPCKLRKYAPGALETLGIRVENSQGEHLGKIEDLVFNPTTGHIRYAVLSFGGVLGVGEKWFSQSPGSIASEAKSGSTGNESFVLVLDVDKTKLKNAPGFDSKRWPDFGNPAYGTSVDEFYGEDSTAAPPHDDNQHKVKHFNQAIADASAKDQQPEKVARLTMATDPRLKHRLFLRATMPAKG